MNCSEARKILYPKPENCVVTTDTPKAMQHVDECASCQGYFDAQSQWSALLKQKLGSDPAPDPLRERVTRVIVRHQAGQSRNLMTRRRAALAAAVLASAAVPAIWLTYKNHSAGIFQEACLDHGKYLNAESQIPSSNPMVIESWFQNKTDYAVRVPSFESADLLGARLCFLKQRKAALVFYRNRGRTVSLFQMDASGINLRSLEHEVIDGHSIWRGSFAGYSLAAFEDRNVVNVLVSDLKESELLEMASAAQSQGY